MTTNKHGAVHWRCLVQDLQDDARQFRLERDQALKLLEDVRLCWDHEHDLTDTIADIHALLAEIGEE